MHRIARTLLVLAAVIGIGAATQLSADEPVSVDAADLPGIVEMFDGMETGEVEARLVMRNAMKGHLILKNVSDEPLNIAVPEAFGAKHVLGQFDGGGGGFGGQGGGQGGGAQAGGGGIGGAGGGLGGAGGGGGGFFSIAPQKMKSIPYNSVCLEHGKTEPMSKMHYVPVPLEEVAETPEEEQLLIGIARSPQSTKAMQAAAWHIFNDMSWQELAAKEVNHANRPNSPYFTRGELMMAQQIVGESQRRAKEAENRENRL